MAPAMFKPLRAACAPLLLIAGLGLAQPLLANDPHLGLTAPAIWYFAHLEAPGLRVIGADGALLQHRWKSFDHFGG